MKGQWIALIVAAGAVAIVGGGVAAFVIHDKDKKKTTSSSSASAPSSALSSAPSPLKTFANVAATMPLPRSFNVFTHDGASARFRGVPILDVPSATPSRCVPETFPYASTSDECGALAGLHPTTGFYWDAASRTCAGCSVPTVQ